MKRHGVPSGEKLVAIALSPPRKRPKHEASSSSLFSSSSPSAGAAAAAAAMATTVSLPAVKPPRVLEGVMRRSEGMREARHNGVTIAYRNRVS
jgi:hypothetical protein